MLDVPMGTITLLFTDIEGSTLLLQHVGEQYSHVLAQCRQLLRTAFQQYHGQEVDSQGDAFFFAFARAGRFIAIVIVGSGAVTGMRALIVAVVRLDRAGVRVLEVAVWATLFLPGES